MICGYELKSIFTTNINTNAIIFFSFFLILNRGVDGDTLGFLRNLRHLLSDAQHYSAEITDVSGGNR